MSFLKKFATTALKVVGVASGFLSLTQGAVQGTPAADTVQKITDDFTKIAGAIVTVETVVTAVGNPALSGPDKLRAAVPLVAQVIQQSEIMVGHKIKDEAKFTKAVEGIASNMADLLNSLE